MKFVAIIPARYASTRFPGKPLAMLGGKPVIQRVYEQVSSVVSEVYVATDDDRIFQCVEQFGGRAVMTRSDHKSGTDRIEEAAEKTGTTADVIINVQGDEPFIQPSNGPSRGAAQVREGDSHLACAGQRPLFREVVPFCHRT